MRAQTDTVSKTRRCPVCGADIKPGPFSRSALNPHYRKRHPEYFLWLEHWTRMLFVLTPTVFVSAIIVLAALPHFVWYFAGGLAGVVVALLLGFYLRVGSFRKAWQTKYKSGLRSVSSLAEAPR